MLGNKGRKGGGARFASRMSCEVVAIEGASGLGKSFLVQSVLAEARRRGYCATAKFDVARRVAFGPLLKLLSSLFKQVWNESDTDTPFHQTLKRYVRPIWPMLHQVLNLPEFLLGPPPLDSVVPLTIARALQHPQAANVGVPRSGRTEGRAGRATLRRRRTSSFDAVVEDSKSPGSPYHLSRRHHHQPPPPSSRSASIMSSSTTAAPAGSHTSSEAFVMSGSATKTKRLMTTCLDVLRVFTSTKFIVFCLDDLHYRPDEMSKDALRKVMQPPDSHASDLGELGVSFFSFFFSSFPGVGWHPPPPPVCVATPVFLSASQDKCRP
jgi:predicted ATPase